MKKKIVYVVLAAMVFAAGFMTATHAQSMRAFAETLPSEIATSTPADPQPENESSIPVQVITLDDAMALIQQAEESVDMDESDASATIDAEQTNNESDADEQDNANTEESQASKSDEEQIGEVQTDNTQAEQSAKPIEDQASSQQNTSETESNTESKVEENMTTSQTTSSGALYTYDEIDPSLFTGTTTSGVVEKEPEAPVGVVVRDFMSSSNILSGPGSTFLFFTTKNNGFTVYGSAKYYCVSMAGAELGSVYAVTTEYDSFNILVVDTTTSGCGEFRFIADSDVSNSSLLCGQVLSMALIQS